MASTTRLAVMVPVAVLTFIAPAPVFTAVAPVCSWIRTPFSAHTRASSKTSRAGSTIAQVPAENSPPR